MRKFFLLIGILAVFGGFPLMAEEEMLPADPQVEEAKSVDQKIDEGFAKVTGPFVSAIFSKVEINGYGVFWIILWLALAGVVFTVVFKLVNFTAFPLAIRTLKGKYSSKDDPGEITHFQALTAAISGTVGLGNIAGVAIGISIGGPGVAFWLFCAGFLGMATKFAECTLGVKYREIGADGRVHGGGMYYLKKGLAERGMAPVGQILAVMFAVFCIFASFGGGNVFQINQATDQLITITGGKEESFFASNQWVFGVFMAVVTGLVIIGGIRGIAKVTSKLVPAMCIAYVVGALVVLVVNADRLPGAVGMIVSEAFNPRAAVTGGFLAAFIWGIRRATFSNEAGIGSAAIAHAAVKTKKPASEGVVALLEPFIDSVIVCTMTSLVIVSSMHFDGDSATFTVNGITQTLGDSENNNNAFGIGLTSLAFESVHSSFKYLLFACVLLFAFSTLITWSYYGLQAWQYLFGRGKGAELTYKLIFCLVIIVGSSASMGSAVDFSDAALFAMSIPNLIGVYLLIPIIKKEYREYLEYTRKIDAGESPDDLQ
ncbi:MAG: alanine/glycine:cation symporter family protein [Akkermansiaceae bacterium]|jgi:AGCS family alanine or glycine:cation symporter|nr:alanine/glycine:cation symporter family protein [Akkermansiaceae bacterium]